MADLRKLTRTENADRLKRQALTGLASTITGRIESDIAPPEKGIGGNIYHNDVNTSWGTSWGPYKPDGFTMFWGGHCWNENCNANYNRWCSAFCAMPGTSEITFEIWGGGGSGGGACCCQQGSPGGAGAYARKTIRGCDFPGGTLGGFCYLVYPGPPTCCSQCCTGIRGCKSYITGCGLDNFCADGGLPGKTCCYVYYSGADSPTYGPLCSAHELRTAATNTSVGGGPGCYIFPPDGYDWCDCACGYGGDYHVGGKLGWFRVNCACGDTCWVTLGIAQPGGVRDQCTRYVVARNWGNACINEYVACTWGEMTGDVCGRGMWGQGAPSATSCGGPCCYGYRGSRGLVKITFK